MKGAHSPFSLFCLLFLSFSAFGSGTVHAYLCSSVDTETSHLSVSICLYMCMYVYVLYDPVRDVWSLHLFQS